MGRTKLSKPAPWLEEASRSSCAYVTPYESARGTEGKDYTSGGSANPRRLQF